MGTKARNIRTTHTKQSLINAFMQLVNEKDFEKITVADLTDRALVNRATFYAHFNDKHELLDYIVVNSASTVIANRTSGAAKFDHDSIKQLVLAVCDFHQPPNIQCRRSYLNLIPLLKKKMLTALKAYLSEGVDASLTGSEKDFYVPMYASMILEAGYLWATGQVALDKEEIAERVSLLVAGNC
ncbi:TetR/AcrR family transcriptional regulator [Paenibacillus sp. MMO-58]|uniref:TetR/AcrR family transcriptional regulator n=1 Tax=Paenibacillus sp. MMO-58 TaxID=3081290 RepID=UPI00301B4C57